MMIRLLLFISLFLTTSCQAWMESVPPRRTVDASNSISLFSSRRDESSDTKSDTSRRQAVQQIIATSFFVLSSQPAHAAVTQAVGSGETACRQANNCLQVGEWDGAVGWNWGGTDRCDPSDSQCGSNGQKTVTGGLLPPVTVTEMTLAVTLFIEIGRTEVGTLRLGLYGKDAPASVQQFVDFVSANGFSVNSNNNRDVIGSITAPVSLTRGGIVDCIVPATSVSLGVPSQSIAYARSRNLSRMDNFVPQNRANPTAVAGDAPTIRRHDAAGLLSVPRQGLGHGGTGFEQVDEAFESAFLITASAAPDLDKNRRVIGQIMDDDSMAFLERLASMPTKRGIRGVLPGQTMGPPLLKVVVRATELSRVPPL